MAELKEPIVSFSCISRGIPFQSFAHELELTFLYCTEDKLNDNLHNDNPTMRVWISRY